MTLYPDLKYLIHLFEFYDGEIKFLLRHGFARDEAVFLVKHYLECFVDDPERFRSDLIQLRKDKVKRRVLEQKLARQDFIQENPYNKISIKSNLGWLVERKRE